MGHATIALPDDLLERARRHASREGLTLDALVAGAIRQTLDAAATPPELPFPVSRSRGLFKPEFAGMLPSHVDESDDLDELARVSRQE